MPFKIDNSSLNPPRLIIRPLEGGFTWSYSGLQVCNLEGTPIIFATEEAAKANALEQQVAIYFLAEIAGAFYAS